MSSRQSESGLFIFKKLGYDEVTKSLRKLFQEYENFTFDIAVRVYEDLKENKIKKNKLSAASYLNMRSDNTSVYNGIVFASDVNSHYFKILKADVVKNDQGFDIDRECINLALNEIFRNNNNTLLKPRRSAYPKLLNKVKTFSKEFNTSCIMVISLDEDSHSIEWTVREGNRAVDKSDDCFIQKAFFNILDKYKWKDGEYGRTVCVEETHDDFDDTPDEDSEVTRVYNCSKKVDIKNNKRDNVIFF